MSALIPFPDISRELFSFDLFGLHIALRYYALAYIVGIIIGWRMTVSALRKPRLWPADTPPMSPEKMDDLMTWIILGIILGGRIGYVLFYNPSYYFANPSHIPMVWEGGMSFHGGFLGVVLAGWLFTFRHNVPKLPLTDAIALGVPWGLMLGRIANFINAELWGRPTDLPWGMVFPRDPDLLVRHPSQLYQAALEGLVLFVVLWIFSSKPRPRLAVGGLFLLLYGIFRFLVEFVRQPDIGIDVMFGWLTRGQLLCLPMIAAGALLLVWSYRTQPLPEGRSEVQQDLKSTAKSGAK